MGILPFSGSGGGWKNKEFLVILKKNKGIASVLEQNFHYLLLF